MTWLSLGRKNDTLLQWKEVPKQMGFPENVWFLWIYPQWMAMFTWEIECFSGEFKGRFHKATCGRRSATILTVTVWSVHHAFIFIFLEDQTQAEAIKRHKMRITSTVSDIRVFFANLSFIYPAFKKMISGIRVSKIPVTSQIEIIKIGFISK